ncbi:MAG TPA: HEAT repeat domain-containing protein [Bryobacteraceae bacterium]|nr:HEAT repeat domain-containing protein [Bryobacteraceae bacterium]
MTPPTVSRRPSRRAYLLITGFAVLLVLFPFLFWYGTWFGRKLTDAEITDYLKNASDKPRKSQHALVQIGERLIRGDVRVRQWYPNVVESGSSSNVELRQTAAWIMGQDNTYEPFHEALRKLLADSSPMVRRNAALSLTNFGDPASRTELLAMLRPYAITTPVTGMVKYRLKVGDYVNPGTLVGRVGTTEIRSPLPGEVLALKRSDGATVAIDEVLVEISPDKEHVWEALRALLRVGQRADLEYVQRYARGVDGMPDRVRQQAVLTMQEVQKRF